MKNLREIRELSLRKAGTLGYETNPHLPLMDEEMSLRPTNEVVNRCLTLSTVVASSYGFDRASAIDWLEKEGLTESLSASEETFMFENVGDELRFNAQVEGIHAFAWSLNFVASLDFDDFCTDDLVKLIPDLKAGESSASFRARAKLRGLEEIVSACDLAYCLDWAVVEASLGGKELPGPIGPYVITERRRALEWMLAAEDWDEVSLDT